MADVGAFTRYKSFGDFQEAAKKNSLAEALTMAQIAKAVQPDYDKMTQEAFIQAATGGVQSLSPMQKALLIQADASKQTWGINPVTGNMEQKPGMLARAGINLDTPQPTTQSIPQPTVSVRQPPMQPGSKADATIQLFGDGNTTGADPAAPLPSMLPTLANASAPNQSIRTKQKAEELSVEAEQKRKDSYTKAQGALIDFGNKAKTVSDNIDSAISLIDKPYNAATGYARLAGGLGTAPNSDSRLLDNYLTTIKANLGFDKLQSMRENSPTGGALGQVSDFENKLLQAVNGALDPYARDQLKTNLQTIRELYPQVLQERARAFQQDYGNILPASGNPVAMPNLPDISAKKPVDPRRAAFDAKKNPPKTRLKYNPATGDFE